MRKMILCALVALAGYASSELFASNVSTVSKETSPEVSIVSEDVQVAAAPSDKSSKSSKSSTVKNQAPVEVEMTRTDTGAELRIRFQGAAKDVRIRAWGVEGLPLDTTTLVRSGKYDSREEVVLKVSFVAPETRCSLAVEVSGKFGGRRTSTVRSFTLNEKAERINEKPADIRTDEDGNPIHVIKSE